MKTDSRKAAYLSTIHLPPVADIVYHESVERAGRFQADVKAIEASRPPKTKK